MGRVKDFFSDLFAIFFLGIGISTTRTKQKKLDMRKLVSNASPGSGESRGPEEKWILVNRAASIVEYENQQAVRLDSRSGEGLAWVEGLRFSVGKLDLKIAATPQDVGIAFHVLNETDFEAVSFHIGDEARDEGATQRVVIQRLSTCPDRNATHEAQFDLPYGQSGDWFKARITISKEVIAVFIDGGNLPALSVANSGRGEVYGSVGLWIGPGSSALVADFRIHEVRGGNIENQISSILGGRRIG
jgi:hypothetical protein